MSQPLRPLLPATQSSGSRGSGSPEAPDGLQRPSKRAPIKAACEACRKRKSKCSAERPRCSICIERSTPCEYKTLPTETHLSAQKRRMTDLQTTCDTYQALFDLLRAKQEDEAVNLLRRIRAGTDIETILKAVHEGDLLLQVSLRPQFRFRYQFPYKREMPTSLGDSKSWSNPYLASVLYEKAYGNALQDEEADEPPPRSARNDRHRMYLVPYHAAELVDARMVSLDVALWTAVPASNSMLRALLEIYFVFEYPFHPFFHKDLFLDDMLNGRQRFCTPILVNAVLAAAWHGYHAVQKRAEYWRPDNLGYRFLAEAQRLLEREPSPRITTIQAAGIMAVTLCTNGLDELSWPLMKKSVDMAHQLSLSSPSPESDPMWQKAAAITSWSLFNWQSLISYQLFREPMLQGPPLQVLPNPDDDRTFYGEIHVRYPGSQHKVDICHGQIFRAISDFRTILNQVAHELYSGKGGRLSPTRVEHYWRSIGAWHSSLPRSLGSKQIALPSHLKLHMHMHVLLIGLFEPFEHFLTGATSRDEPTPNIVLAQSRASLQTLVRLYYLRHGFESYDPTMILFVTLLAWTTLREYNKVRTQPESPLADDLRSTLVLCAKFMWDQSNNYFLAEAVFHFFKSCLPSKKEVRLLREVAESDEDAGRIGLLIREIRSSWSVGLFPGTDGGIEELRLSGFIAWCEQTAEDSVQRVASAQISDRPGSPDAGWSRYPY